MIGRTLWHRHQPKYKMYLCFLMPCIFIPLLKLCQVQCKSTSSKWQTNSYHQSCSHRAQCIQGSSWWCKRTGSSDMLGTLCSCDAHQQSLDRCWFGGRGNGNYSSNLLHTHASCNAVTLVWGSPKLAPIILCISPLCFAFLQHCILCTCMHNTRPHPCTQPRKQGEWGGQHKLPRGPPWGSKWFTHSYAAKPTTRERATLTTLKKFTK